MKLRGLPIVAYAAVVVLVFGHAIIPPSGEMSWGDDIHRQYYFFRQFFNSFLKEGIWPWWNPYVFAGTPFIANAVVNIWYPPTWLFAVLPLTIAYSWHIALHILWAMIGMRVLTRSWVAGLVFGLSGFFSARVWAGHVDVIAAASWMPWVVWAFRQRSTVFAAAVFAMQLLAGYQTMAFMTAIAVMVLVRPSLRVAIAGLLGLGLAGIQIVPLQEFFRQSIRTFDFPYSWHSYGSLTWDSLRQFLIPFPFGDQLTYSGPPPNYAEHAFFVGRVGVVVAVLSLLRRSPMVFAFGFLALFGLWVSLGPNAPIDLQYVLWKIVPMYHYLRLPPRHLILVVFGLSGLIGLGLSSLRKSVALMAGGALVLEMVLYAKQFVVLKPVPETRHDPELIRIFTQDKEPYRVLTNFGAWIAPRDSFDFNAGMSYRIYNATGYDPSILRSYYEFIDRANGNPPGSSRLSHDVQIPYLNVFSPATDELNIKYVLVPRAYDPLFGAKTDRFALLREDVKRDYRLYENKTVKPRFFLMEGSVEVIKYSPNEIILTTDAPRDGVLTSSEVFYPGWEGYVDGKKVDIQTIHNTFRSLSVPKGKHSVIYRYNPRIFLVGGAVSFLSLLTMIVIHKRTNSTSV